MEPHSLHRGLQGGATGVVQQQEGHEPRWAAVLSQMAMDPNAPPPPHGIRHAPRALRQVPDVALPLLRRAGFHVFQAALASSSDAAA
jgi:hypothetical protein